MKNTLISAASLAALHSSAPAYELLDLDANVEPSAINNADVVTGQLRFTADQAPVSSLTRNTLPSRTLVQTMGLQISIGTTLSRVSSL